MSSVRVFKIVSIRILWPGLIRQFIVFNIFTFFSNRFLWNSAKMKNFMNESKLPIPSIVVALPFFSVPLLTFGGFSSHLIYLSPFFTYVTVLFRYTWRSFREVETSYLIFLFLLLRASPSRFFFLHPLVSLLLRLSSSATLYFLEQHYLIIDRMILPSTRMAWPAEHTFEFVNVRPWEWI